MNITEKVARALRTSVPSLTDPGFPWRTMAVAAIRAMRQPTDEMKNAAAGASASYGYGDEPMVSEEDAVQAWQTMIDVALKEQPQNFAEQNGGLPKDNPGYGPGAFPSEHEEQMGR